MTFPKPKSGDSFDGDNLGPIFSSSAILTAEGLAVWQNYCCQDHLVLNALYDQLRTCQFVLAIRSSIVS